MIVTIHQPEHMPWLGFFDKVSGADLFVILDNVQFRKNYFQNRNRIKTADGSSWITVPVNRSIETLINEVRIADDAGWKRRWWNTVYLAYKRSRYFDMYAGGLEEALAIDTGLLSELNINLIKCLLRFMGISTRVMLASELGAQGKGSDMLLDICRKVGADGYLSGVSGKEYLKMDDFSKEGIDVSFQEFHHPIYRQLHEPFMPCMSAIDLLFNYGSASLEAIKGVGVPVMEEIFH